MSKGRDYTHIFEQVAKKNHTTVAEVRREMEVAIQAALENPNPKIQGKWAEIPYKGDEPTPEEVITYVMSQTRMDNTGVPVGRFFEH